MRRFFLLATAITLVFCASALAAEQVTSPDGSIRVNIETGKQLSWSLSVDGREVVKPSPLAMKIYKGDTLGKRAKLVSSETRSVDETITPVVAEKRAVIADKHNELRMTFKDGFALAVRAYDDGVAWRFETMLDGELVVENETAVFDFAGDFTTLHTVAKAFQQSFECNYTVEPLSKWKLGQMAFAPVLVSAENGLSLLLTEADLESYPGMFLARDKEGGALRGVFAPYPASEAPLGDRHIRVKSSEPFIAKTAGTRAFPWRVVGIARRDAQIIENDIVYRLAPPCAIADTSWIRPGKVAWDWWNANNLWNVSFKPGLNTETYKHYIDFAAANGLEYIILDEGWSDTRDLTKLNPEIDLQELLRYGKEKNVGLVLWCVWCTLDKQRDEVLPLFEQSGVKGVKVDFMDRDDQKMVEFYSRMARATAEHRLLLDFHGAYKPTGLRRTWPNLITREGVNGMEQSKWCDKSDPEYCVTIPYIRMFAGPMDYTPGAMRNAQKADFKPVFDKPMSLGTRCQQLAMYVVYESPLQMLSDSPSAYAEEPESTAFIAACPVTWDETRGVDGRLGDFVVVARKKGGDWWLGGMSDWSAREVSVPLSFLGGGTWNTVLFTDGPDADTRATSYTRVEKPLAAGDTLTLRMAPGGGFAARFTPAK